MFRGSRGVEQAVMPVVHARHGYARRIEGERVSNFTRLRREEEAEEGRGQHALGRYPRMRTRSVDPDIKRPLGAADDEEQRPDVLERRVDPGFFLFEGQSQSSHSEEAGGKKKTRTWSSRRAACSGVSPCSTLPPKPLYLHQHNTE